LFTQILLPLTAASRGLLGLLTCGLVCERVARNRRERRTRQRRTIYAEVLSRGSAGELEQLVRGAARSVAARGDLVDALALTGWSTGPAFAGNDALLAAATGDAEHAFRRYRSWRCVGRMVFAAVVENFGYRQASNVVRAWAFVTLLRGSANHWGEMSRTGFGAVAVPAPAPLQGP
jgi:hypothetical protein